MPPHSRILITGASGFVGRHAAVALAQAGHEVVATGRHPRALPGVGWRPCDLLEPGPAEALLRDLRPDLLLHLAWTTAHGRFWTDPANDVWAARSLALALAAAEAGARRLCMVGTCFEYAFDGGDCVEGRTPLGDGTPYGRAKNACRSGVAALAQARGLSFAWARLFHLFGPEEHPQRLVASLCRALVAGEPARMSSGGVWRDYMDARDAGAAIAALALGDAEGTVNVASGEAIRIATIGRLLADLAGRPDLLHLGALPDRPDEPERIVADVARLRGEVGFGPPPPLRERLGETLDGWRSARHGAQTEPPL
jgi:nucleoside-diphosphate-sugar epimerase